MQELESSETFFKLCTFYFQKASEKVAELHESKLKMLNFINGLGDNMAIPKKNPVSIYCEKFEDLKLTKEEIMKMLNQRI